MYNIVRYYFIADKTIELLYSYISFTFYISLFFKISAFIFRIFRRISGEVFLATQIIAFFHFSRLPVNSHVYFRNCEIPDTLGRKTGGCLPSKELSRTRWTVWATSTKGFPRKREKDGGKTEKYPTRNRCSQRRLRGSGSLFFYDRRSVKSRWNITKRCDGGFARRHKFPGYTVYEMLNSRWRGAAHET